MKMIDTLKKISQYYTQFFRGETTVLQVVVKEWRLTKHQHTNRPKGSHCFKCRLKIEINQLARIFILRHEVPPVIWFNASDVEDVNENRKEKIKNCARDNG